MGLEISRELRHLALCFAASCENAQFCRSFVLNRSACRDWDDSEAATSWFGDAHLLKRTDNGAHYGAFKIEIAKECKPADQIACPPCFMCILFIE